jgi:hypothetical protein
VLSAVLKAAIYYYAKASLYCSLRSLSKSALDYTITGSLLTNTLASKRSTHSVHLIALAVETFLVLQMLATCVLHALTKLSLGVNSLALLCSSLARSLFFKVGNN